MTPATILLVEDEDVLRNLLRDGLQAQGYAVQCAAGGGEALDWARQSHPFDLVLTDIMMPHMTGPELVDVLRRSHPQLKVIFMSGYAGENNASLQRGLDLPGAVFLQKPFRLNVLWRQVRTLLAKSE